MQNVRCDGILVACKAAELKWPAFNAILTTRFAYHQLNATELTQALTDFIKLSGATARRMLRFWLVRSTMPGATQTLLTTK